MTELLTLPPPPDARAAMAAIPGMRTEQIMVGTQQGPGGHLGPEEAGAILLLQATFTDPEGFEAFWRSLVVLVGLLQAAPGFIRRYGFADGPHWTLIAFWRSADDARAFAARPEHRNAVRDLYRHRWQYSHFAAIWEMTTNHEREFFCPTCHAVTPAALRQCSGCGAELLDVYRSGQRGLIAADVDNTVIGPSVSRSRAAAEAGLAGRDDRLTALGKLQLHQDR